MAAAGTYDASLVQLNVSPLGGYGTFGSEGTYHHIFVGADPASDGPTGPTGPTGARGRPCIVVSSTWDASWNPLATTDPQWPNHGEFFASNGGTITGDGEGISQFKINEVDCFNKPHPTFNTDTDDIDGMYLVVRGWSNECSGNNTFHIRRKYQITAHSWFEASGVMQLNVNHIKGFGDIEYQKYHEIVIGADIADEGPTGPTQWIFDGDKNFYGPWQSALASGVSGNHNVICGPSNCSTAHLQGSHNTIVGALAWEQGVSGSHNTMIGAAAGQNVSKGNEQVFIGWEAGSNLQDSCGNIAIGSHAANAGTGNTNIAIGRESMFSASGDHNIAIGHRSLYAASGDYNIALGFNVASSSSDISHSIVFNASDSSLDPSSNRFYVQPIAQATKENALYYDPSTYEITWGLSGGSVPAQEFRWNASAADQRIWEPSANDVSGIQLLNTIIRGTDSSGITIGDGNSADGKYALAMGVGCKAGGDYAVSLGKDCFAGPLGANDVSNQIAIGRDCSAIGQHSIAMGWYNQAGMGTLPGSGQIALGYCNTASGQYSVAMGATCTALGFGSFADGSQLYSK